MNNRIIIIREATVRIVKMLAEKDVKVTQRGAKAYVEYDVTGRPIRVNIPYIPDDASEELIDAVQGFIDHEVAHILFTDYTTLPLAKAARVGRLHNIIEDSFIERKMTSHFAGSGLNLRNVGAFFLKQHITPELNKNPDSADGILFVPAVRAWAGQTVFIDYMADKWHLMEKVTSVLGDAVNDVPKCLTSHDCLAVAIKFRDLLEAAKSKSKPEDEEEGDEEGKGKSKPDPKSKPEEGESDSSGEFEPSDPEEGEGESDPEDSDDSDPEDSESDSEGEGKSDGEGEESKSEGEKPEGESDGESDSEGEESDGEKGKKPGDGTDSSKESAGSDAPSMMDELESKLGKDYDEAISSALTELSVEDSKSADYLVYTTELDVVEPMVVGKHRGRWNESDLQVMTDEVDHMIGPLQKDLERAVAARSAATWSAGHRSGRINPSSLSRLTMFNDDRAFRRKNEANTKNVAIELMVDCSGSMTLEGKIKTAAYAAYGLSAVLDRMMIPNEVIGFTTQDQLPAEMKAEESRLGIHYARHQTLYHPILKGFNERMTSEVKRRFAALPGVNWLCENVDGESVQVAAARLAQRREKRKILMVLSDGNPACPGDHNQQVTHLKKVVKQVEASGIDVIAVGINSSAPTRFYSKSLVINDLTELPTTVIAEIKRLLMK